MAGAGKLVLVWFEACFYKMRLIPRTITGAKGLQLDRPSALGEKRVLLLSGIKNNGLGPKVAGLHGLQANGETETCRCGSN